MKTTLKYIAVALIASVGLAAAQDEKKEEKPAKKGGRKGLMAADANKDKKVSLEEFKTWAAAKAKPIPAEKAEALFKKRDLDKDGSITVADLKAARDAAKKKKGDAAGGGDGAKKGKKKDPAAK